MNEWDREGNEMESGMIHFISDCNELFHTLFQEIKFTNLARMRIISVNCKKS